MLTDCKAVVEWVLKEKSNIASLESKIGVIGDSAGGHLSSIISHDYKNLIDYQILIYPCVDLHNKYDSHDEFTHDMYYLVPELLEFFCGNIVEDKNVLKQSHISPIFRDDFENMPHTLIIAAELDPIVDNSKVYFDKLKKYGNNVELKIVNGTIHGFFHNGFYLKQAFNKSVEYICQFLNSLN
jgi:acetyl esterase